MKKIAIVGIGHVGSTTAHTLIQRGIADELVLFDQNQQLVTAEVNDLIQGQIDTDLNVKISGNDLSQLADCDILIMAAGDSKLLAGDIDRFEELHFTQRVVEEWAPKIIANHFSGIILSITNPCDVIARYLQKLTGLPAEKVIGTGTSLDSSRMKQAVAEFAQVHPNDVAGYVLGEHGDTQFILWSQLTIGGQLLLNQLSTAERDYLEQESLENAAKIFLNKDYTSYGIANQAARICQALLTDSKKIIPVSTFLPEADIYISQPCQLGKAGVEKIYTQPLNQIEVKKWQHSIARIQEMQEQLN